jgi:hypothetical protein
MNKTTLIAITTATITILGGAFFFAITQFTSADTRQAHSNSSHSHDTAMTDHDMPSATTTVDPTTIGAETPKVTLNYTDSGFAPSPLTLKAGTALTITNNSSGDLMFASEDHASHNENTELNMNVIKPSSSGTLIVTKTGSWGYHNHDNDNHTGRLIVTN